VERIAIDLGSQKSQICVRDEKGHILEERRYSTEKLGAYLAKREPGARVLLETSAEAFAVAEWARQCGHEARVVPASLVRALGVGERGLKNDQRDARKLSEMDCRMDVPSVHIPSPERRDQQARLTARDALVAARTQLVNVVRSFFRTQVHQKTRATPETLSKRVREKLLETPTGVPDYIEHVLATLDALNEQIARANEALEQIAREDPVCKLLQTMPGVGPVTSLSIAVAVDEVGRFESASKLTSYFGLTPGESTTGFKTKRTGITRAGCRRPRWTLVQAAWTMVRVRPDDPLVQWFQGVAGRRGKKVAITALARKMAGILYAMWRDQTSYEPKKAAKAIAAV
jgi:transposase